MGPEGVEGGKTWGVGGGQGGGRPGGWGGQGGGGRVVVSGGVEGGILYCQFRKHVFNSKTEPYIDFGLWIGSREVGMGPMGGWGGGLQVLGVGGGAGGGGGRGVPL